jgi:hypothetical protein
LRPIFFVLLLAGCFPLDRVADLEPGTIRGRTAPLARVNVDGSAQPRQADDDGVFVLRGFTAGTWVLRVDDGDRGLVRSVTIGRDVFGRPAGVDLGDLALKDHVDVAGVVVDRAGAPVPSAVVVALRSGVDVSAPGLGLLAVESVALSDDDDGAFSLLHLAPGPLHLFAFSDRLASDLIASDGGRLTVAPVAARTARVTLRFAVDDDDNAQGDIDVWIMPAGSRPVGNPTARLPLGSKDAIEIEPGLFDVFAVRVGAEGQGALLSQVAVPDVVTLWGLMLLRARDPCAAAGDVDDDGIASLPLVDFAQLDDPDAPADRRAVEEQRRSLWATCAAPCLESPRAVCTIDGEHFDCDDDGDGQPDVSEPPACLGARGSTDSDHDGRCDRVDVDVVPASVVVPFAPYLE